MFYFSMEEKRFQVSLESKLKRKNQLTASRSNRLRRFGDRMPELLESINRAHAQGRFIKKPVGPIGDPTPPQHATILYTSGQRNGPNPNNI